MPTSATPESTLLEHDGRRYPGGKNLDGLYQFLLDRQALHTVYVEAFVGSGALLRRKLPALKTIAIDANPKVAAWWIDQANLYSVDVVCGCGIEWLESNADRLNSDVLVYLDPPYLHETRTRRRLYGVHEMTRDQHVRLLSVAKGSPARVMLSGYPSKLYDNALLDWHRAETEVITRGRRMRTEVCYTNYDPAACGPAVRPYIGDNFRQRERIKRQQRRWCRRLLRLPPGERRAILLAMIGAARRAESKTAGMPDPTLKAMILSTLASTGPLDDFQLWQQVQRAYVCADLRLDDRVWEALDDLKADGLLCAVAADELTTVLSLRKQPKPEPEGSDQLTLF